MPIVSEVIAHIIHHVDAEKTLVLDPSQKEGMKERADYAKLSFNDYEDDSRDITEYELMQEVSDTATGGMLRVGFRRMLDNIITDEDPRPRLAIQEWVGKETERRGG